MELQPGVRIGLAPRFHSDLNWAERLRLGGPAAGWRPATAAELEALLAAPGATLWERDCCLFRFPEHLRRLWWDRAAEELLAGAGQLTGYEAFLREVAAFARFKGLPLLPACRFDVLARPPGERSPLGEDSDQARLLALVNLGDEVSAIALEQCLPAPSLVRVLLQPGDGCWFPAGVRGWPADTMDRTDLDVLLLIRAGDLSGARKEGEEARNDRT